MPYLPFSDDDISPILKKIGAEEIWDLDLLDPPFDNIFQAYCCGEEMEFGEAGYHSVVFYCSQCEKVWRWGAH